jgi:hypothetical protein
MTVSKKTDGQAEGMVGSEKLAGGGESQGGAYPNPHTGKEKDEKSNMEGFLGHGGQSMMAYHGTGQLGEDDVEGQENDNAPAGGD